MRRRRRFGGGEASPFNWEYSYRVVTGRYREGANSDTANS
jgi:hypothetical protein